MKRLIGVLSAIGLLTLASAATAAPAMFSGNGHYYEVVSTTSMDFDSAKAHANSLSHLGAAGHLVSITSAEEQTFVASLGVPQWAWMGGFQAVTTNEPAGGWTWIDGEPWSYTNWDSGEPNNGGGLPDPENCLHWAATGTGWNDVNCASPYDSMVVEYDVESAPVTTEPVPTLSGWLLAALTLLLLAGGFVLLRNRRA